MTLKFFEVGEYNTVLCENCINEWKKETEEGKFKEDPENGYDKNYINGEAETPVQCDGCLTQSDDYDEVLDDE